MFIWDIDISSVTNGEYPKREWRDCRERGLRLALAFVITYHRLKCKNLKYIIKFT